MENIRFLPGVSLRNRAASSLCPFIHFLLIWVTWFHKTNPSLSLAISFKILHWLFSIRWFLLTISRSVEILILTRPSGPVAKTGPSQTSAGLQTSVSRQHPSSSQPVTVCVGAAPAQRWMQRKLSDLMRSVFQFRNLSQFLLLHLYLRRCLFNQNVSSFSVNIFSCEGTRCEIWASADVACRLDNKSIELFFLSAGWSRPAARKRRLITCVWPSNMWNQQRQEISSSQSS